MKLKEIIAISGQGGLFRFVAQSSSGIIVEALADGRRSNVSGSSRVSSLSEIAIYTDSEEVPLSRIFTAMFERSGGGKAVSPKSDPALLRAKMDEVLPGYDRERVHVSDMKKLFAWYNALVEAGMTDFSADEEEEAGE